LVRRVTSIYVKAELEQLPGIRVTIPQSTYLIWIDYRELELEEKDIMNRLLKIGKLALEPGTKYGEEGHGFLRMNVACSFETVQDGVRRFKKVFE